MEETKTVLIKITKPNLSGLLYALVFLVTPPLISYAQSNFYYYLLSLFFYVPWIVCTIKELKSRVLKFTDNQLIAGNFTLYYKDIEDVVVYKKRLNITVNNKRWLTKLIYLDFKNTQDKENTKNKIDEWKIHNNKIS
ncbi:hypothetical protein [Paenibacillus herberti]|uniref:Uncharacterized protein n=1 Tax=Paenibacillus herberti TaxID=1619309 RepID=A0A229NT45_9BACL|nr:hypothetical protein [Paenibacillus herberti]OXM12982.1 hypothetical protein CGZ75_24220 [Paenibacillus herberti]